MLKSPAKANLTMDETAEFFGVTRRTIQTWTKTENLPHFRIGKRVRYPLAALQQWIADRLQGGHA